ncbi:MAG TPA: hypothetical protein DCW29_04015, partial [Janthinobacterium sp.]|nr:hypothetical protein [Janthinobacterium sp.]
TQAAAANPAANGATAPAQTSAAPPAAPAATPVVAESAPGDTQNIPDKVAGASVTPAGNGLPPTAVPTALPVATEHSAAPLAQDPAVAAAIAAYHLNDSPFTAVTNGKQERASDVKTKAVPVVEALKRVLPIEKIA